VLCIPTRRRRRVSSLPGAEASRPDAARRRGVHAGDADETHRRAGAASCAPTLFIPSAQKGASSALAALLATHPQVLRPVRGSHYKEPGAYINAVYYRQSLARRASRFPWFRDGEPFVVLDATVTYASESRLPAMRAALDAPRAFVVFALREPVARAFSDFRFCYRPYFLSQDIGFDAATLGALDAYDACYGAARAFYEANRTAGTRVEINQWSVRSRQPTSTPSSRRVYSTWSQI
jgi:hypothetical protein